MSSEIGAGTRFDVRLPLERASAPESAKSDELVPGLRVLVVEDNPVNQQLAKSQLERLGLVPVIVGTGEAAIEVLDGIDGGSIDVVLMDHQLPGISGIETTKLIRKRPDRVARVPVVGLSASASSADAHAFIDAGMDDFLAKPATLADLSSTIAKAHRRVRSSVVSARDRAADQASSTDAEPTVVHLDIDVLEGLIDDLDDPAIVAGLVQTFLAELEGRTRSIAGRSTDTSAAQRAAHTLKSSARLLGATALADACQSIESDPDADADVEFLSDTARRLMTAWLARQTTTTDREDDKGFA